MTTQEWFLVGYGLGILTGSGLVVAVTFAVLRMKR